MDYKDILITSKDCAAVAYSKFLLQYKDFDDVVVCFIEGKDFNYYFSKVEKYSKYSSDKIVFYSCGGRTQVEIVNKNITKCLKVSSNIKILYFADSDFDLLEKVDGIYYTDYYSVENFYCQRNCLESILKKLFNINAYCSDYKICLDLFDKAFYKYRKEILKLNAYCYCIRKKEQEYHLEKMKFETIKLRKLVDNNKLSEFKMKNIDFSFLCSLLPNTLGIVENDFVEALELIDEKKYRGKWELEFFCWFLNEIKKSISSGEFNLEKNSIVRLNFDSSPLTQLNAYSIDTENLILYISAVKKG